MVHTVLRYPLIENAEFGAFWVLVWGCFHEGCCIACLSVEAWEGWMAGRVQSYQLLSDFFPLHLLASANHLSRATLKNPGPSLW